jgi:NAD(P)-dependent dehydrogenase (short-subunit alcohol dehydrogenase family)
MPIDSKVLNLISLKEKTAVVTGAASGIGFSVAQKLAQFGARIALLDTNRKKGGQAAKEIQNAGRTAKFYACDVSQYSECKKRTIEVVEDFGGIDILVNSAGIISRKSVVDLKEEEWDRTLNVNLKSVFLLSHHVIPHMVKSGGGTIVNIGSGWGLKGGPLAAAYCAAKGGVVNLTRAMAIDHGSQNIRVNCVCPGDTDTDLLRQEASQIQMDFDTFIKMASERPISRIGKPEDVSDAVLFLVCDMSRWITGAVLVVDGGGLA